MRVIEGERYVLGGRLDEEEAAAAYSQAWSDRLRGRHRTACDTWKALERAAVAIEAPGLAAHWAGERAISLTHIGRIGEAAEACDSALALLGVAGGEPRHPVLDRALIARGTRWMDAPAIHRLRAEQARRNGRYRDTHAELQYATALAESDASEGWAFGRAIMSHTIRMAGDFEGGMEIARLARETVGDELMSDRWNRVLLDRGAALALLAQGRADEARVTFAFLASQPEHQHPAGQIACDLGLGEAARQRSDLSAAAHHFGRARASGRAHAMPVQWIQAQLCLAEVARAQGGDSAAVAAMAREVLASPVIDEHPFLKLRALIVAAATDRPHAEGLLDAAERQLGRFQRRSCDEALDSHMLACVRDAVERGRAPKPVHMDFL
jgi:hypothetical protein